MYRLCLKELVWEKCEVKSKKYPSPRDKLAGWAEDNRIYFFGGFGPSFEHLFIDQYGEFDEIPNYVTKIINSFFENTNNYIIIKNRIEDSVGIIN